MKNKDREVLELRRKILDKNDFLNRIVQLSWRIKKAKELYPMSSTSIDDLNSLIDEFDRIYGDFLYLAQLELELVDHVPYTEGGKNAK